MKINEYAVSENIKLNAMVDDLYLAMAAPAYNKKLNESDFYHIRISEDRWERVKKRLEDLPSV